MEFPQAFTERMRQMLGEEYPAFLDGYRRKRWRGLRVNTLKLTADEFEELSPFPIRKIPWTRNGYYYPDTVLPAGHPYYAAGLYYLQEPSAMTPADRLPAEPGDRVLDLCAAPGGKATELAAKLKGEGLLVANDASNSRAKALLRNLELFGARNIFVTAEVPERLEKVFPLFFDKILVDAPCSGEGMFRKSDEAVRTWSVEKVTACSRQQKQILSHAHGMLRPGGMMMYSTCTFSPEENEQVIGWFTDTYPDIEIIPIEPWYEGFSEGNPAWADGNEELRKCVRIWPHKMEGEGHFLCLMRKKASANPALVPREAEAAFAKGKKRKSGKGKKTGKTAEPDDIGWTKDQRILADAFFQPYRGSLPDLSLAEQRSGKAWLSPKLPEEVHGLNFLRNGLYLGEWKKNRFEPSQPLAMALSAETWANTLQLDPEDERVGRYLRGETIEVTASEHVSPGWVLVCVKKFSLGWGKFSNGVIKNKLLNSWRR